MQGGCLLCRTGEFQAGSFSDTTILMCDLCDREFHIGCLRTWRRACLHELPEGHWTCSPTCAAIKATFARRVASGPVPVRGHPGHMWQLIQGVDKLTGTGPVLRHALAILQESFDPIMDLSTDTDLLPLMVRSQAVGDYDYANSYTLVLWHGGKPVVSGVARVFGRDLAELPLIATSTAARRQGHARVLVTAFEDALREAGVVRLSLPAAHETVETWRNGFGFKMMEEELLEAYKKEFRCGGLKRARPRCYAAV